MKNIEYARAYTEVLEILSHLSQEEYSKIPIEKIEFYQKNMDNNYDFKINLQEPLSEQNISRKANAIIINLFRDYFATEEQKLKIQEILELNNKKAEIERREKHNSNDLFKSINKQEKIECQNNDNILIKYKAPFFIKFKNFILKILHINN